MTFFLSLLFWLSVLLVVYTYLVYPVLLVIVAKLVKNEEPIAAMGQWPELAIVIAAYNEEKHISQRIENLLSLTYPEDRFTIYIGSDGSTDRTAELVRSFNNKRVVLLDFAERRGKASVLNDTIAAAKEPIVVLSDANTEFAVDDLQKLVRHFADPRIGAVCGELVIKSQDGSDNQDSLYWRIERKLKFCEGRIGGLLGANGANYAIRRELFAPLPADTIIDDFMVVMRIAANGHRVIYDSQAVAFESEAPSIDAEFTRRTRIGKGNYQAFFRLLHFLRHPFQIRAFTYLSHKVLRWFVPHLLLIAFIASAILYSIGHDYLLFWMQVIAYLGCLSVYLLNRFCDVPRIFLFPTFIMSMNVAFAVGFVKYIKGDGSGAWQRTSR